MSRGRRRRGRHPKAPPPRWTAAPGASFAERHAAQLAPVRDVAAPRPAAPAAPTAQSTSWWARRWIAALERFSTEFGHRLQRGRDYANSGRVHEMRLEGPVVVASVTGSRPEDYEVRISLDRIDDGTWQKVIEGMASRAAFLASLLAGEMPGEIDEAFSQADSNLFPASEEDLWTSCTCPDWANPCKHVAAAHYVLADLIDKDPFVLFDMRGRSKDEVLGALGKALGAGAPEPSGGPGAAETIGVVPDLGKGYDTLREAIRVKLRIQVPPVPAAVLRQIGSPPGWSLPTSIAEVLRPAYESAGQLARSIALAVDSEALAAVREEAAPRRAPEPPRIRARRPGASETAAPVTVPALPVVIRRKKVTDPAGTAPSGVPGKRTRPR